MDASKRNGASCKKKEDKHKKAERKKNFSH